MCRTSAMHRRQIPYFLVHTLNDTNLPRHIVACNQRTSLSADDSSGHTVSVDHCLLVASRVDLDLRKINFPMTRSLRLCPLHYKGILTLGLLLLAESISVTNAVKLWGRNDRFETFSSSVCVEESCSSSPLSRPRHALGRFTRRLGCGMADCCLDCSHCTKDALNKCRGGAAAADALAEAASKVMPYNIPLNGWKVIFQAFLTTLNVLCWLIPLRSKKISENKLALSLANAFSGGVFLSLAFGHLIPECAHMFEGYNEITPYMLVLSGYLLIFFVEKVAFDAHEILHEMEHGQHKVVTENGDSSVPVGGRSAVILLGALAVHSVLEMTALGLADTFGDSAILTLSIALHQVSINQYGCRFSPMCASVSQQRCVCHTASRINRSPCCILEIRNAERPDYSFLICFQCHGTCGSGIGYGCQ